ncbi:histone-fold-containing protein [Zychaea mexicana]|uniref:histone-fold-containing protein n=1 Tax=Zychaea mexicana TaxID=64656 RepID=UPI0022FEE21E|nr:histone-fold-containing protein [Zychaea mexicana]KAI9488102.1 histone-fold-containing protein [Zychaea mexicana]
MASEESNTQQSQQQQQKPERALGSTTLPIARVKRVIKEDKEVSLINAEATFCVAYATELFMEYLVKEGFTRARKEKRKTIFYKDLASAVSEVEQFEFLEDVIPHTMTLKAALERRKDTLNEDESLEPSRKKSKTTHSEEEANNNNTSNELRQEDEEVEEEERDEDDEEEEEEEDDEQQEETDQQ